MATGLLKAPNIIIYPSPDQRYESNTGLYEQDLHALPTFIAKGNRIVLNYNGDYNRLKDQLSEGIARAIWEAQVKESLSDQAKGAAIKQDIPFWFKEGAIRYFAHKWPLQAEDALRRSFEQNHFQNWEQVITYQPRLSGQAFCYYLAESNYPFAPTQLWQQLKKKNLYRSARLVTKKSLDSLYIYCFRYYEQRFAGQPDTISKDSTAIPKKKGIIQNLHISPNQEYIAYTSSYHNRRTVYIYNTKTATTKKAASYALPPWLSDQSTDPYPILQWQDDRTLDVLMPHKGKIAIKWYRTSGSYQGKELLRGLDGASSFSITGSNRYLLNAYRKAQSDIVTYDADHMQYLPHTSDSYEDAAPAQDIRQSERIWFTSLRPDTIKATNGKDSMIYKQGIYTVTDKAIDPFLLADSNAYSRWEKPLSLPGNRLLVTNTNTGTERYILVENTSQPTAYTTLGHYRPVQYLPATDQVATWQTSKKEIQLTKQPLNQWIANNRSTDSTSPWLQDYRKRRAAEAKIDSILKATQDEEPSFLEQVLLPKNAKELARRREDSIINSLAYHPKKVKPYVLQLHSTYFSARVNNDYFINRYQPYKAYQGQFKFPEISGMVQGGFTDLLENHHLNLAFRLPVSSEGSDFFVKYENTARKWDWSFTYFRKVEQLKPDAKRDWKDANGRQYPNLAKVKTHYYEVAAKYPLSYYLSVGITEAIRQDRTIFLATEKYSLTFEDIKSAWSITTLSVNWNKLQPTIPLLYRGFKARAAVDVFKGFSLGDETVAGNTIQLQYQQPLYRYITLAAQASAGYSAGQGRILYNLGQVDNTITPRTDSNVHFAQDAPYAFQTLATPFRGYLQNTLYGDRYLLLNADVYFPIFQTLVPIETPLQAVNLLQLGLFTDAATAKEGWKEAAVQKGWLWSYGMSARTMLAGYPIRFDIAWPGTFNKKPVWYLSLSLK